MQALGHSDISRTLDYHSLNGPWHSHTCIWSTYVYNASKQPPTTTQTRERERESILVSGNKTICEISTSAAKQMRTPLFWAITQRVLLIAYRRFGTRPLKWERSSQASHSLRKTLEWMSVQYTGYKEKPQNEGLRSSWNVCQFIPKYTASHPINR
jgi:hypothetical protein